VNADGKVAHLVVTNEGSTTPVEGSVALPVAMGTKKVILTYKIKTQEYPSYVSQQSLYNDAWNISVHDPSGMPLYELTQQVNAQLQQAPVWGPQGDTGEVRVPIDVTTLASQSDTTLTLRATSLNVGDGRLNTSVTASLDSSGPFVIGEVTPDEVDSVNDGTYYSIPRAGEANVLQRTFDVEVSKAKETTLTAVAVELLNGDDGLLMPVLLDTAPGADGVQVLELGDESVKLRVRCTLRSPASVVAGVPPPTRLISYRITVKGLNHGTELRDQHVVRRKRALWHMPQVFGRFGDPDAGGDDWTVPAGYQWMTLFQTLLREINDVSGEHGIDIGHDTHERGMDIDTFHFYSFPGGEPRRVAGSGDKNYQELIRNVISAFDTVDNQSPPDQAIDAYARVGNWIARSRTGLTNLANQPAVQRVYYCLGGGVQGLPAGWCASLLTNGKVTRTVPGPNGQPVVKTLDFHIDAFELDKLTNNNVHNDHVHVTLDRSLDR
jgi:hypothetical protein